MAVRTPPKQSEHDDVVRASSKTYSKMEAQGYKVATNPDGEKNQWVGSEANKQYPDVIVWNPSTRMAAVIEEIESEDSVNDNEAKQWADYAALGIPKFVLVVPKTRVMEAARIVDGKGIRVTFEKYR